MPSTSHGWRLEINVLTSTRVDAIDDSAALAPYDLMHWLRHDSSP